MRYFERDGDGLLWRNGGETLLIAPWGEDSLRVRSTMQGDVLDTRFALLEPEPSGDVEIGIEDERAYIRNGAITARVELDPWFHCARLGFYDRRGGLLLGEHVGPPGLGRLLGPGGLGVGGVALGVHAPAGDPDGVGHIFFQIILVVEGFGQFFQLIQQSHAGVPPASCSSWDQTEPSPGGRWWRRSAPPPRNRRSCP